MKLTSILVVDDEPDNFDVIETLLSQHEFELHYAASGQDAMTWLETFEPDMIFLDVMMPNLNGFQVCQAIKARTRWQSIPIIMVTALTSKEDLARCLEAGADDFISKPVNSFELRARVQSMLRIKKQYDKIQEFSKLQRDTINILGRNLDELTGNLGFSLSHQLNTPLNGIVGVLELLKESLEEMSFDEIREMLGWADQSARRLENLTKKFLIYLEMELSTTRQQSIGAGRTWVSVTAIAPTVNALAESANRSQDLIMNLEEAEVTLSERYLLIIVEELVDNALKFSRSDTPIKVTSYKAGSMLTLTVHDAGQGMTPDQVAKIGSIVPMERKTNQLQGMGLGLKIVKRIVELAGGQLSIHSVLKHETKITILLPIAQP